MSVSQVNGERTLYKFSDHNQNARKGSVCLDLDVTYEVNSFSAENHPWGSTTISVSRVNGERILYKFSGRYPHVRQGSVCSYLNVTYETRRFLPRNHPWCSMTISVSRVSGERILYKFSGRYPHVRQGSACLYLNVTYEVRSFLARNHPWCYMTISVSRVDGERIFYKFSGRCLHIKQGSVCLYVNVTYEVRSFLAPHHTWCSMTISVSRVDGERIIYKFSTRYPNVRQGSVCLYVNFPYKVENFPVCNYPWGCMTISVSQVDGESIFYKFLSRNPNLRQGSVCLYLDVGYKVESCSARDQWLAR